MGRVFQRGELKQAVLVVLADLGEAHGYAIMGELESRVGGGWKPSPGAIYPAILALVETGHLRVFDQDGQGSTPSPGPVDAPSRALTGDAAGPH
jgi:DNA-binding PadR family transcriptional regulator